MPIKLSRWLLFLLIVSACTPQQLDTPIPTLTLIPPTITPTITPIPPTITPQDLPQPQDFLLTPSPTPLQPIIPTNRTFDSDIVQQTRNALSISISVSPERLQLVQVSPRWYVTTEDCSMGLLPLPSALSHGFEIVWRADDQIYTYLTWGDGDFVWCKTDRLRGEYLTAVDPIADELSALAIRRISQQLGIASDVLRLEDMLAVEWQDSSLGCPLDSQTYADVRIDGYRIIITDGETSYLFHTDSVQLVPCEFDRATS